MDKELEQAIAIVDAATAQAPLNRATHIQVQNALNKIKVALSKRDKIEKKT